MRWTTLEREAFESHLAGCARCREEVERLRPAAEALPRSVTPLGPPPSLKASLMEEVEGEARERARQLAAAIAPALAARPTSARCAPRPRG